MDHLTTTAAKRSIQEQVLTPFPHHFGTLNLVAETKILDTQRINTLVLHCKALCI